MLPQVAGSMPVSPAIQDAVERNAREIAVQLETKEEEGARSTLPFATDVGIARLWADALAAIAEERQVANDLVQALRAVIARSRVQMARQWPEQAARTQAEIDQHYKHIDEVRREEAANVEKIKAKLELEIKRYGLMHPK